MSTWSAVLWISHDHCPLELSAHVINRMTPAQKWAHLCLTMWQVGGGGEDA